MKKTKLSIGTFSSIIVLVAVPDYTCLKFNININNHTFNEKMYFF